MTVAISNMNCERAVNWCGGGRAIIRFPTNPYFISLVRRCASITNANTILRNLTLTLSTCNKYRFTIQIFFSDELEHFFIFAFYFNFQRYI